MLPYPLPVSAAGHIGQVGGLAHTPRPSPKRSKSPRHSRWLDLVVVHPTAQVFGCDVIEIRYKALRPPCRDQLLMATSIDLATGDLHRLKLKLIQL